MEQWTEKIFVTVYIVSVVNQKMTEHDQGWY